jgi:hypothetical protein
MLAAASGLSRWRSGASMPRAVLRRGLLRRRWYPDGAFVWRPRGAAHAASVPRGGEDACSIGRGRRSSRAALVRVPPLLMAGVFVITRVRRAPAPRGPARRVARGALLAVDPAFLFCSGSIGDRSRSASRCVRRFCWSSSGGARAARGRLPVVGLLAGIGLYDKITFAWFLVGSRPRTSRPASEWPRPRRAAVGATLAALALGAAPFIAFNVVTPRGTLGSEVLGRGRGTRSNGCRFASRWSPTRSRAERLRARERPGDAGAARVSRARAIVDVLCAAFPFDGSWLPIAVATALVATATHRAASAGIFACRFLACSWSPPRRASCRFRSARRPASPPTSAHTTRPCYCRSWRCSLRR